MRFMWCSVEAYHGISARVRGVPQETTPLPDVLGETKSPISRPIAAELDIVGDRRPADSERHTGGRLWLVTPHDHLVRCPSNGLCSDSRTRPCHVCVGLGDAS